MHTTASNNDDINRKNINGARHRNDDDTKSRGNV